MAIKEGLEAEGKSVGVLEVTSKVKIIGRFKGHFKSQNI